jgi:hypothetical protein
MPQIVSGGQQMIEVSRSNRIFARSVKYLTSILPVELDGFLKWWRGECLLRRGQGSQGHARGRPGQVYYDQVSVYRLGKNLGVLIPSSRLHFSLSTGRKDENLLLS